MKTKVAFIVGTGHCGSTLIDLVLGSHENIFSLGEIRKLNKQKVRGKERFWTSELISELNGHFRYRNNKLISYDYHWFPKSKIFEDRTIFYRKIFKKVNSEVLIDSSKNLTWIKRGYFHLAQSEINPVIIHLKRNPCAVVNSYYRKYRGERTFEEIVEFVKQSFESNQRFYNNISNNNKISLQYEDFCQNPSIHIKQICDFLEQEYTSEILNYWEFDHYNISGNSGTNSLIKKYKGDHIKLNPARNDTSYYKDHPLSIKLDERWKESLSEEKKDYVLDQISSY